jgi:hypothetical protein
MNAFPGGQTFKELLAIIKVMVQLKEHRVKVAMRTAPLSPTDLTDRKYRNPESLGWTKLKQPPAGIEDANGPEVVDRGDATSADADTAADHEPTERGGGWYEVDLPWLWAEVRCAVFSRMAIMEQMRVFA